MDSGPRTLRRKQTGTEQALLPLFRPPQAPPVLSPERVALAVDEARKVLEHDVHLATQERSNQESRLAEVKQRANRLIDQVTDGVAVTERLTALEEERAALETQLAQKSKKPVVALHPRLADQYRQIVASLEDALHRSDSEASAEARDLMRRLIETVVVTPLPAARPVRVDRQRQNRRPGEPGRRLYYCSGCGSRI